MNDQGKVRGAAKPGAEHVNTKGQKVPARGTELVIPLEEKESDNAKTPPKLMLVRRVQLKGNVAEVNPDFAKDEDNTLPRQCNHVSVINS